MSGGFQETTSGADPVERTGPESHLFCGMQVLSEEVHVLRLHQQQTDNATMLAPSGSECRKLGLVCHDVYFLFSSVNIF